MGSAGTTFFVSILFIKWHWVAIQLLMFLLHASEGSWRKCYQAVKEPKDNDETFIERTKILLRIAF